MTKRNERTSPRVVKVAAKVFAVKDVDPRSMLWVIGGRLGPGPHPIGITMGNVQTLAGSCMTQAADKPKSKR